MNYTSLTQAEQTAYLKERIHTLEREHFQNTVTLNTVRAGAGTTPTPADAETIAKLEANLAIIDAAHASVLAQISAFDAATSQTPPTTSNAAPDSDL